MIDQAASISKSNAHVFHPKEDIQTFLFLDG
jgi:hypothetical protein